MNIDDIRSLVRDVPDFPAPGIQFKDITPLLAHARGFQRSIELLQDRISPDEYDIIVAPEARGFIFGCALAAHAQKGFAPIRKPGKLPYKTHEITYSLEYGTDTLQIHQDAVTPGQRVLLVDDVLATGGTMAACAELVEKMGATISHCLFFMELGFLKGRDALKNYRIESLIKE